MDRKFISSIWFEFDSWNESFDRNDANTDVIVEFDDKSKYSMTFFTYQNVQTLRDNNKSSGECLSGKYFCATDMILISEITKETIIEVIEYMISRDEISLFCRRLEHFV